MIITSQHLNASALKIFVAGKIDAVTAAKFRQEVAKLSAGASKIIFDFKSAEKNFPTCESKTCYPPFLKFFR